MHIDEEKKSNLKKNFRIVRCLKHDNIVPYRALYLHRGQNTCYLVMEYCEYPCIDRKKNFLEDVPVQNNLGTETNCKAGSSGFEVFSPEKFLASRYQT